MKQVHPPFKNALYRGVLEYKKNEILRAITQYRSR